jgi:ABC-2 type transport system ATP-binding protein
VLEPDAGQAVIAGEPVTVRAARTKRHIGYVPQEIAIYPDLTARENLRFFARLSGLYTSEGRARTEKILATIGLREGGGDLLSKNSGGVADSGPGGGRPGTYGPACRGIAVLG